jgi:hypothetical protein
LAGKTLTRVQDATLVGDSWSSDITLVAAAVDVRWNDSIDMGKKILGLRREVERMGMN